MGANTGVRSPAQLPPSLRRAVDTARAELEDPGMVALAIAAMTLVTFTLVRLAGGAPNVLMELGFLPIVLAAYAYGRDGGLATGVVVAAALGPAPALIGFDRVEGPIEWLIRVAAFGGIGALTGHLLEGSGPGTRGARVARVRPAGRPGPASPAVSGAVASTAPEAIPAPEEADLLTLAHAAESREGDAGGHLRRLQITTRHLALRAGMSDRLADEVARAAMFHDLGKVRVPEQILLKPEPLDPDEWTIVRNHPIWTEEALAGGEHLALAREVGRWHHENWDGTGYPDGLYGDRIPLAARMVRITDAFDAMTNRRPYQPPVSFEAALEELQANAGQDFDPDLVRRFTEVIRSDHALRTELSGLREG
jgi:HD-GYP domain-containing protein (c-di-GMP phosphodiesterase class II)